jgi:hypothetical protein
LVSNDGETCKTTVTFDKTTSYSNTKKQARTINFVVQ